MTSFLYVDKAALRRNTARAVQKLPLLPTVILSDGDGFRTRVREATIECPHCAKDAAVVKYDNQHPVDDDAKVFVQALGTVRTKT